MCLKEQHRNANPCINLPVSSLLHLFDCICMQNPKNGKNRSSNYATSGSLSHGSAPYPSATLRKDNAVSLNKICPPSHIPCWSHKSELAFLQPHSHLLWKGLSAPYVSTDEETGWAKPCTCGFRIQGGIALRACRVEDGRRELHTATDDCTVCQTRGVLKHASLKSRGVIYSDNFGRQTTQWRVDKYPQSEWCLTAEIWIMSHKTTAWPLPLTRRMTFILCFFCL